MANGSFGLGAWSDIRTNKFDTDGGTDERHNNGTNEGLRAKGTYTP